MKMLHLSLLAMGLFAGSVYAKNAPSSYMQEFTAFKHSPAYERMFAPLVNESVKDLQKDLDIFKQLSLSQRMIRFMFMVYDIVIVTPQTMPSLYSFIDTLCKKNGIATPTIFIGLNEGFFNAAASKLFKSTGAIIIGKQMLKDTSDSALEAVLAHEIGHIKHDHVNKSFLILAACATSAIVLKNLIEKLLDPKDPLFTSKKIMLNLLRDATIWFGPCIIINKAFEKEADAFACENGYAAGMVEAFELFKDISQQADNDLVMISDKIYENKKNVTVIDYLQLKLRLGMVKVGHKFGKAYEWLNYNTPWGAHPSHDARIEAAQEYIANHQEI